MGQEMEIGGGELNFGGRVVVVVGGGGVSFVYVKCVCCREVITDWYKKRRWLINLNSVSLVPIKQKIMMR